MGGRLSFGVKSVVAFAAFQVATAALVCLFLIDFGGISREPADRLLSELAPMVALASLWSVAAMGLMGRRGWARWFVIGLVVVTNPVTMALIEPSEGTGLGFTMAGFLGWVVWAPAITVYLLRSKHFGEPDAGADRTVGRLGPAGLFLSSLVLVGTGVLAILLGIIASFAQMDQPGGADAVVWILQLGGLAAFLLGAAMFIATMSWVIWRAIKPASIRTAGSDGP